MYHLRTVFRHALLALTGCAAILGSALVSGPAAARPVRPPLALLAHKRSGRVRGRRKAARGGAVRLGDWEGWGSAGPVSFQVVRRHHALAVADLVVTHSTTCKSSFGQQRSKALGQIQRALPVSAHGSFQYRSSGVVVRGTFADGAVSGRWTESRLSVPGLSGEPPTSCSTPSVRWSAKPQRRVVVRDGSWSGRTADGQPVSFRVSLHGRILTDFSVGAAKPVTSTGVHITETESSGGKSTARSRELTGETSESPCWIGRNSPNPEAFISPDASVAILLATMSDPKGIEAPDIALSVTFTGGVAHGSYTPTGTVPQDACVIGSTFTATP